MSVCIERMALTLPFLPLKGITKDIVDGTPTIADGFLSVPKGPGLGITLNRENLNSYLTKGKKPNIIGEKP